MTLVDFMKMTRANLLPIIITALTGILGAWGISALQPTVYTATSQGYVTSGGTNSAANQMISAQVAQTYVRLVQNVNVAERIIKDLGLRETPQAVAQRLEGSVDQGQIFVVITAAGATAQDAKNLAESAVRATAAEGALVAVGGKKNLKPSVWMEPMPSAVLPGAPSSPDTKRNLGLGLVVGLLMGYAMSFARKTLDSRVRFSEDVERIAKAPVLGIVPDTHELRDRRRGGLNKLGPANEALRQLRTNLRFVDVDNPPRSVVVTSGVQGEGKSTLAANLARVLSAAGQRTALIEADLRRPNVAMIFGLDGHVGVTQVLAGDVDARDVLQPSEHHLLSVIPAGRIPPNPSELLGSRRMRELIDDLARDHFVILDAPPLLPVTDAGLLSAQTDGVLLVLATGQARKEQLELSRKVLDQVGGNLLGTVLNKAPRRAMGSVVYGYGYGGYGRSRYGYGYGYGYGGTKDYVSTDRVNEPEGKRTRAKPSGKGASRGTRGVRRSPRN